MADMGLNLLLEMLASFDSSEAATAFYQTYYMQLVTEIFAVMTGAPDGCALGDVELVGGLFGLFAKVGLDGAVCFKGRDRSYRSAQLVFGPLSLWELHGVYRPVASPRSLPKERVCNVLLSAPRADTFHKPGFKMHARILHHLFMVLSGDVIRGPLWPGAQPAAFPNNTAFVHAQVSSLLTTSFPNMRAPQIEARPSLPAVMHSGALWTSEQPPVTGICSLSISLLPMILLHCKVV